MQPSYLRSKGGTINPSKKTCQVSAWAKICVSTKRCQKTKSSCYEAECPQKVHGNSTKQKHRVCLFQGCYHTPKSVVTAAPATWWSWPPSSAQGSPISSSRDLRRGRSQPSWNTSMSSLSLRELCSVRLGCAKFWCYGLCVLDRDTVSFFQLSKLHFSMSHITFAALSLWTSFLSIWFSFTTISPWPC